MNVYFLHIVSLSVMYKMIWRPGSGLLFHLPLFPLTPFSLVSDNLLFLAALANIMTSRKLEGNVYFTALLTLFSEVCHRQGDVMQCFRCLLSNFRLVTSATFPYTAESACP